MKFKLEGILPAILTPFKKGGTEIDFDKAAAWAETLAKKRVHGIFMAGSSGEGLLMSAEDRKQLACVLMDAVGHKIKVVVQSGCLDVPQTIDLTRHALEIGAHAVAVYAPGFYRYDDESLYGHFAHVAKAVPEMPMMLYNIPRYTGNSMSPKLIFRLAHDFDSIVGMKDSSGDIGHLTRVIAGAPKGFVVINGADDFSYQAYLTGAAGSVALTANVTPELFLSIYADVKKGKLDRALTTQNRLNVVCDSLGGGAMISMYKEAVRLLGHETGFVRPPQRELIAAEKRDLRGKLKAIKLI
jgi:dihydrodipicolinate synthase/N-acetylneuraminate lyase